MAEELIEKKETCNKITYQTPAGDIVTLSSAHVKAYLVSGNKDLVTEAEINMFLRLCQYQKLNPFLKEAYLIKYDKNAPASMVVGKEAFTKRAELQDDYDGQEAGIIIVTKEGKMEQRIGTAYIKDEEKLIGGWAKIYRKRYSRPIEITAMLEEYNTNQSKWRTAPATMIRKVALVQALREAYPISLGAMYDREEIGVEGNTPIGDVIIDADNIDKETGEILQHDSEPNSINGQLSINE